MAPGLVNASHCVLYLVLKMTTVDEHEYYKMMRTREARIRTFMQLELEACLEEVSWIVKMSQLRGPRLPARGIPGEAFANLSAELH